MTARLVSPRRSSAGPRLFLLAVLTALALVGGSASGAAPREAASLPFVSPIFGDHMVLQRGKSIMAWG